MANFKVVFKFTQPFVSWNEQYYRFGSNLNAAGSFSNAFITSLMAIKHPLTQLRSITVSDVANNRTSKLISFNRPGTSTGGSGTPDIVGTSALVTLNSQTIGAKRIVWMRGLNDYLTVRDSSSGRDAPSAALTGAISAFVVQLQSAGFECRRLVAINPVTNPRANIQTITVGGTTPGGKVTIVFDTAIPTMAGGNVIISQLDQKDWPGLKGTFPAYNLGLGRVDVNYKAHKPDGVYTIAKGKIRDGLFQYEAIDYRTSAFKQFGTRKTGGSPLGGRGRRSTGVRRSA